MVSARTWSWSLSWSPAVRSGTRCPSWKGTERCKLKIITIIKITIARLENYSFLYFWWFTCTLCKPLLRSVCGRWVKGPGRGFRFGKQQLTRQSHCHQAVLINQRWQWAEHRLVGTSLQPNTSRSGLDQKVPDQLTGRVSGTAWGPRRRGRYFQGEAKGSWEGIAVSNYECSWRCVLQHWDCCKIQINGLYKDFGSMITVNVIIINYYKYEKNNICDYVLLLIC